MVEIEFAVSAEQKDTGSLEPGEVNVKSAKIIYEGFDFEGIREQGESDISFSSDEGFMISYSDGQDQDHVTVKEIPQGTYRKIEMTHRIASIEVKADIKTDEGVVPVQFVMEQPYSIRLQAMESDGTNEVVLIHDISREMKNTLKPDSWFSGVPFESWNNVADDYMQNQGPDNQGVVIDAEHYSDIYLGIVNQMDKGLAVAFE